MGNLVELGRTLQGAGTDCVVLGPDGVSLHPLAFELRNHQDLLANLIAQAGDVWPPLHLRHGEAWLRAEPLAQEGETWLIALVPRTCQRVLFEAERLQARRDALQELAASTAREMNDAMTIVQGRLELLMAFALENPEASHRHASIALEHSERITSALHNLRLVGSGGLLRFQGLDVEECLRTAMASAVDQPEGVELDLESGLRIVGHAPAVQGVLTGVLRAVAGEDGASIRARAVGDDVTIDMCSRASRHVEVDALPLGIVAALVDALGGSLHFAASCVQVSFPRELDERGLLPDGMAILLVGQPSFCQTLRGFLEPDVPVRIARTAEQAEAHLRGGGIYAVVTELLLPGRSGLALSHLVRSKSPEVRVLLIVPDDVPSLPPSIDRLIGPIDRVRLIRALTS